MADNGTDEYAQKLHALVEVINNIKLKLMLKHGVSVRKYWDER